MPVAHVVSRLANYTHSILTPYKYPLMQLKRNDVSREVVELRSCQPSQSPRHCCDKHQADVNRNLAKQSRDSTARDPNVRKPCQSWMASREPRECPWRKCRVQYVPLETTNLGRSRMEAVCSIDLSPTGRRSLGRQDRAFD
jgi:hypothetical protein